LSPTITVAPVRKSVVVNVDPARAFEIFTQGFDRWWPKKLPADPALAQRNAAAAATPPSPVKESIIEPFLGGRWFSRCEDGSEGVLGHVLAWDPGHRLLLSWEFSAQWTPNASASSEVEVTFKAEGPGSTRVELEHRHFERLGKEGGEKMRKDVEGGWPARLDLYAVEVARQSTGA
jgi:uncharacterized protein YndB with AHSA1/START domain